jgi:hypothetical protein
MIKGSDHLKPNLPSEATLGIIMEGGGGGAGG